MMLAGRGLAKVITGGQNTTAVNEHYRWIANGYVLGLPVVFLTSVGIAGVGRPVIRRSALGMMIESIGINPEASRLAGLNRRALLITVYMVSAFLAGIAGIFSTGTVMTVDVSQTGYQFELDAILAVVIGGTSLAGGKFSLAGAAIGAVLIATLDKTVVFLGIPASATPAFKATVIIVLYVGAVAPLPLVGRQVASAGWAPRPLRWRRHEHRRDAGIDRADRVRRQPTAPPPGDQPSAISAVPGTPPRRDVDRRRAAIFVAMVIYGQLPYGGILQYSTISNLLINNSHLVILAVGLTFVILTGGIDLSVGAVIAFSSVAGVMLAQAGWNPYLVVVDHGADRLGDRARVGMPDRVLRHAAVHRHPVDDVPRPRAGVDAEHRPRAARPRVADQGDRPPVQDHRRREGERPRHHARRDRRRGRRHRRAVRPASHPVRPHRLRRRRVGAVGQPDGPARAHDQAAGST